MRYLFITSPGLSNGIQGPAQELAELFRVHGREVDLLHIDDPDFVGVLQQQLQQRRPDLVLSFGGFGDVLSFSQPGAAPQNLWSHLRIPFFKIIYDVHAYMPQHHYVRSRFQVLSYMLRDHAVLRMRHARPRPGEPGTMIGVLPPIVTTLPGKDPEPITERTLYFHKNGNSSAALEKTWEGFPLLLRQALFDIAAAMRHDIDHAFVLQIADAVAAYIAAFERDGPMLLPCRDFILAQVDDYVRRLKGELIVKKLKDLPVVVNGQRWGYLKEQLGDCRLRFIEAADHADTSQRMRNSLGTINMGPNTDLAIHERSARAIAFGHGLVDYENQFSRDNAFPHTFRLADDSLPQLVDRVLSEPRTSDEFEEFRHRLIAAHPITAALDYFENCAALVHFANDRSPEIQDYVWWPMPEPPGR
ncbi:MAG TPA: hypothetical protein VHW90_05270 [Stellaceae bacterium]|nr:hypothetical protein [Stellaceae bacterium]